MSNIDKGFLVISIDSLHIVNALASRNQYYFYVLYSLNDHKLYKGYTTDIGQRLLKHNSGGVVSTRHRRPLVLIYLESFHDKSQALARERLAKSPEAGSTLRQKLMAMEILNKNGRIAG